MVIALIALLGSWRASLVAAVSIASALAAAFLVFQVRGVGLNMMVVAGLLVAIAVVIDDAIVSADNIRRRLGEAGDGTAGPVWRVMASAATEIGGPYAVRHIDHRDRGYSGAPDAGIVGVIL